MLHRWIGGAHCRSEIQGFSLGGEEDDSRADPHVLDGDEPAALLGTDHGPNATEGLLHALYARADVFVHATRFEGSSLVTLEAMAHGLPVLATRAGGIPDKVVDGVTGLLVAPGDVEALGRGLTEAAAAPERWQEMGRRGRERAVESFSWPVLAQRTLALYSELLEARRP